MIEDVCPLSLSLSQSPVHRLSLEVPLDRDSCETHYGVTVGERNISFHICSQVLSSFRMTYLRLMTDFGNHPIFSEERHFHSLSQRTQSPFWFQSMRRDTTVALCLLLEMLCALWITSEHRREENERVQRMKGREYETEDNEREY